MSKPTYVHLFERISCRELSQVNEKKGEINHRVHFQLAIKLAQDD